ncbi:MAG: CRISPR-associated endonuclease Cas1 [Firmicutes bacterium ADurb.Bin373]|nr:MAG: CRISPR-associated endonuclease Cas1 [Firmicutes bacterium ADurb.Bin373]
MFRTLIVTSGESLRIEQNWLVVETGEKKNRVPLDDIYSIVLDNLRCTISSAAITAITGAGAHILICDDKHLPQTVVYPLHNHYRPLNVIKKQLALDEGFKAGIWQKIVQEKIKNQAKVLDLCGVSKDKVSRMCRFAGEVLPGDPGNREGIAAKWFFRALYGSSFIRHADNAINAALNYGYSVIRSAVGKTLVAYGYNCVVGLHHINESNPFNLADDLMEPLRPIVDLWVDLNSNELVNELSRDNRRELVDLINWKVLCDNKRMGLRNAIDKYVSSLTTAMERKNVDHIKIPAIIAATPCRGEEGDD